MEFRSNFPYTLRRDLYEHFFNQYTKLPSVFDQIFDVQNSEAAQEIITTGVGMGIPVLKNEGESIKFHSPMEGWEIIFTHDAYADGIEVSHELQQDSYKLKNFIQDHARTWATGIAYLKENIAATVFNSNPSIYDGAAFFSGSHTNKAGGAFDNDLGLTLTSTNLQTAIDTLESTNAYDERGNKILIKADTLLVAPALRWTAAVILKSPLAPGDADNDINVMQNILNLVVWPFLSSSTAWYVGCAKQGVRFYNREGPTIDTWEDKDTKAVKASIYWRGCAGVLDWRFWVRGNS